MTKKIKSKEWEERLAAAKAVEERDRQRIALNEHRKQVARQKTINDISDFIQFFIQGFWGLTNLVIFAILIYLFKDYSGLATSFVLIAQVANCFYTAYNAVTAWKEME